MYNDTLTKTEITNPMIEELQQIIREKDAMLEEFRNRENANNEFYANLSHELKTPLNVILGSQQLLALYLENNSMLKRNGEKFTNQLRILKQNCNRLLRLINNFIDVTKIDSGFYSLHPKNYNIVDIIEEITLSVAQYVESKGVSLIFDTDIEDKIISCDADMIERILLNLLSNAIKFTSPGDKIFVEIHDRGSMVDIIVKDTGIGIPKDRQKIIFNRFSQAGKSLTRDSQGSGIGLDLVKSLVEMHGGTIEVQSKYMQGSTFTVHLPAKTLKPCKKEPMENDMNQIPCSHSSIEKISVELSDIYEFANEFSHHKHG